MRRKRSVLVVLGAAAVFAVVAVALLASAVLGQERTCYDDIQRVIPVTHKGVRHPNVLVTGRVPVPCETPSSGYVETRINDANPVDVDREAVDGGGRW